MLQSMLLNGVEDGEGVRREVVHGVGARGLREAS
jgi:hypothetical protein